jgi:hypothetical protein
VTLRLLVGALNVALGCVYTSYGVMSILDLRRGAATRGELHFGLAWVAMAFTCGPHHLEHGLHLLTGDGPGGLGDVAAVLVGLPAGATWFGLRIEAFRGGRGDRPVTGTPTWVRALPPAGILYAIAMAAFSARLLARGSDLRPILAPNLWLVVLYVMIGYYLGRTQIGLHSRIGGWSLSGLCLTMVFPTCAMMHASWVLYAATGTYDVHWHLLVIDWLAVPAALYFVWVVRALYHGELDEPPVPRAAVAA